MQARQLYYQGLSGDKEAVRQSDQLFTELYHQSPTQPLLQAYYGSLRLLEAGRTWALWKKNALSKEGLTLMDKAVEAAPKDLEIRFLRAATTYHLPSFFGRKQQSESDFAFLAPVAPAAARNGTLDPKLAAAALFYHGQFCAEHDRKEEARQAWRTAVGIAPDSVAGKDASERLRKL